MYSFKYGFAWSLEAPLFKKNFHLLSCNTTEIKSRCTSWLGLAQLLVKMLVFLNQRIFSILQWVEAGSFLAWNHCRDVNLGATRALQECQLVRSSASKGSIKLFDGLPTLETLYWSRQQSKWPNRLRRVYYGNPTGAGNAAQRTPEQISFAASH